MRVDDHHDGDGSRARTGTGTELALDRRVLDALVGQLEKRRATIADHAWRDRDPAGHLEALKSASEGIDASYRTLQSTGIPPQLDHFLSSCSYDKALAMAQAMLRRPG